MAKPKWFSKVMGGGMMHKIKDTGSIVVIVSQTRDDINPRTFSTKTRSGGKALKFYASHEYWLAVGGTWEKEVRKKKRKIGMFTEAKVSKNSITGKQRQVRFPLSYSYGVDDIRANIDFLIEEGHWKGTKEKVTARDMDFDGTKNELVDKVEVEELEDDLAELVEEVWHEIEEAMLTDRKKRYE